MTAPSEAPRTRDPAVAFDEMRGELALLRRAIEGLAAERAEAPDYNETLGQIDARVEAVRKTARAILERPALELTPEVMAARIHAAADQARRADGAAFAAAGARLDQAADQMRETAGTVLSAHDQRRRFALAALGGALAGVVLWALLPGAVARLAPESWRWPEALAARTLALSRWDAGVRLLATADPQRWREVALAACPLAHSKAGKEAP